MTTLFFMVVPMALPLGAAGQDSGRDEEAYEHNRQGMIAMSQARFEEAIRNFEEAAALAGDYEIQGRPLVFTPAFMGAWASEKIGHRAGACEGYTRFLEMTRKKEVEETKAHHASEFVARSCR